MTQPDLFERDGAAQAKALLAYLMTGKTITAVQALGELGIASFHRRVTDLKERGWHINSEWVTVPTRYGSGKTKVKQYTINQTTKGQTL
jgi:hypothetical protein